MSIRRTIRSYYSLSPDIEDSSQAELGWAALGSEGHGWPSPRPMVPFLVQAVWPRGHTLIRVAAYLRDTIFSHEQHTAR